MITVVDQVRPWFTPRSTLATMTQPHVGAHINRNGTGSADEPAGDEHGLAAVAVGERAGEEVGGRLHRAEGDDEGERGGVRGEPEDPLREQRQDRAFLADHPADERVDGDEQHELARGSRAARAGPGAAWLLTVGLERSRWRAAHSSGPPIEHRRSWRAAASEQACRGHGAFAVAAHHRDTAPDGAASLGRATRARH